ncbi:guanylate cyclase soluble subunit beta-2-like [Glandiceps talaboti]
MFRALGASMSDFFANLDFLHSVYMKTTYPHMTVPSFRVENLEDGAFILHYYSNRKGLKGIVIGIVKEVAKVVFHTSIEMEVLDCREEFEGGRKEHTTFLVRVKERGLEVMAVEDITEPSQEDLSHTSTLLNKVNSSNMSFSGCMRKPSVIPLYDTTAIKYPVRVLIDPETFCKSFPFHIVFDQSMTIQQSGANLQKLCPAIKSPRARLDEFIVMQHPQIPIEMSSLRKFINMIFMVDLRKDKMAETLKDKPTLSLRGQMVWMESLQCIIFLGSPRLVSLQDLQDHNMHFSDIAAHDVTRDLILLNQQRTAEIELANQLEQKKEELRVLMRELQDEKLKTDILLYSMLPKQVANDLREGRSVEAGEYDEASVLFSDIVKFTDMCSECKPMQIVHLLNQMYLRFDRLTTVHDVYKVETIGDAYMVVGGLPTPSKAHAEKVANFGLGILKAAQEVTSPSTGEPIQIRVGIHSGAVVAGVVGKKMPRYCLFGDTVNTASRIESNGVPGKVHISLYTHMVLHNTNSYKFETRGEINIKGKGKMFTYFCVENTKLSEEELMGPEWGQIDVDIPTLPAWGVSPTSDLKWEINTDHIVKKAQKRLFFLRRLRSFRVSQRLLIKFYRAVIESVLTLSIIVWWGNATVDDRKRLNRIVNTASSIIGCQLPFLNELYNAQVKKRAQSIVKDDFHPALLGNKLGSDRNLSIRTPEAFRCADSRIGCLGSDASFLTTRNHPTHSGVDNNTQLGGKEEMEDRQQENGHVQIQVKTLAGNTENDRFGTGNYTDIDHDQSGGKRSRICVII